MEFRDAVIKALFSTFVTVYKMEAAILDSDATTDPTKFTISNIRDVINHYKNSGYHAGENIGIVTNGDILRVVDN